MQHRIMNITFLKSIVTLSLDVCMSQHTFKHLRSWVSSPKLRELGKQRKFIGFLYRQGDVGGQTSFTTLQLDMIQLHFAAALNDIWSKP